MPESKAMDGKPQYRLAFAILELGPGILPGRRLNGVMIKADFGDCPPLQSPFVLNSLKNRELNWILR